jgi:hypothetical protein
MLNLYENIVANPRQGKIGLGKDFTGTNFAVIPDAADLRLGGVFTIEFWMKVNSINGTWTGIIGKSNSAPNGRNYTIWLNASKYLHFFWRVVQVYYKFHQNPSRVEALAIPTALHLRLNFLLSSE